MNRLFLIGMFPLALGTPVAAQDMSHMSMAGMDMSKPTAPTPHRKKPAAIRPHAKKPVSPDSANDMSAMGGMDMPRGDAPLPRMGDAPASAGPPNVDMAGMPGMSMPNAPAASASASQSTAAMPGMDEPEIPKAPPPPPARDHAADRYYDPAAMATARAALRQEHGGAAYSKVMLSLAEYQARARGGDGYRWDGMAFFGGDINRFVVKSEGEGSFRGGLDSAEAQGLYSRAITPFFDLQAGVRQDFSPHPRTYATVGLEGLVPYWFDVQGAVFVSNKGEVLGRAEGTYDLRLTQRAILQPRVELNLAAQNSPETRTGSGLSNAELGLRLRYEISREFAPYIGLSYDRRFGRTADYSRAIGEGAATASVVFGVRAFF